MKIKNDRIRCIVGIIYSLFFAYLLFFASFRKSTLTSVNWIPFKTTSELLEPFFISENVPSETYSLYVFLVLFGNLFLLLPAPILFKLDWDKTSRWLFIFLVPCAIETTQYLFSVGSADVDDVILNSAGCYLGFWIRSKRI